MNILELLNDQVSDQLAHKAATFLGESETQVSTAVKGIFPLLAQKLIDVSDDKDGTQKIFDMATAMDTSIRDNINALFTNGAGNIAKLMNSGSAVLNLLMGSKTNQAIDNISSFSGLKTSATSSLIKMAAPFLMSVLGKQIQNQGLDVSGFAGLINDQKSLLHKYLPDSLQNNLSHGIFEKAVDALEDMAVDTKEKVKDTGEAIMNKGEDIVSSIDEKLENTFDAEGSTAKGLLKWLIPSMIVLALLSFVLNKMCATSTDTASASVHITQLEESATETQTNPIATLFENIDETAKNKLDDIAFVAGSAGDQIMKFIENGSKGEGIFTFEQLLFEPETATIIQTSAAELDNIASILKAYPLINVVINAYTDSKGDSISNKQLSKARANAVKARLIAQDIDPERIKTKGHASADGNNKDESEKIEIKLVK